MSARYGGEWRCRPCRIGWQVVSSAADARSAARLHAKAHVGHRAEWRGHDGSICKTCGTAAQ